MTRQIETPILLEEKSGAWLVPSSTRKAVCGQNHPSQKFQHRCILKGKDPLRLKNNTGVHKLGINCYWNSHWNFLIMHEGSETAFKCELTRNVFYLKNKTKQQTNKQSYITRNLLILSTLILNQNGLLNVGQYIFCKKYQTFLCVYSRQRGKWGTRASQLISLLLFSVVAIWHEKGQAQKHNPVYIQPTPS